VADNNEPTLRNALDAVNTGRKWALLGIGAMLFSVALLLFMLFMMLQPAVQQGVTVDAPTGAVTVDAPSSTRSTVINGLMPLKILWVSSAIQLFFVACATAVLMLHMSRMTRAVLRAIESIRR
jgi:hypothetical protein